MYRPEAALAGALIALLAVCGPRAYAQQADPTDFNQNYVTATQRAVAECKRLWSDHAFDVLRAKIPLDGEKPTLGMLTNVERLHPKDRPVADLAIATLEKCRAAYAPLYAMLPPSIANLIHGSEREQDSLIAELYRGKITFGEYNVAANRIIGRMSDALSGLQKTQQNVSPAPSKEAAVVMPPARPKLDQPAVTSTNQIRLALIIGNSKYVNLPRLANPANDARAVAEIFQKMNYRTQLLLDASEESIRKAVRAFANESEKAETAVVFYAGHGAQLNGNNYLLPVDIDIPRTEADIQFTGLKVDDLVNSIRSNVKVIFLDACRDNPALFKNIVTGRGASPIGLAPASSSNFQQKPGGGVFIAYATDAGSIADDGRGQHSPFTQALLRNLQKPISIDDMFSLVTREVRLVTKNAQRPYKYASLENIVCLSPACSSSPSAVGSDLVEQARRSQSDELRIALQTNDTNALETYLQKYPDTPKRAEIQSQIQSLRRAAFTEWTLIEVGNKKLPWYFKLSSIQQIGDRVAVKTRYLIDDEKPKVFFGKSYPKAYAGEDTNVYDCKHQVLGGSSEETIFDKSNKTLFNYKFGDPRYLDFSVQTPLVPGSVASTLRKIACNEDLRTPLVDRERISKMDFKSLSSTVAGDGDMFYEPIEGSATDQNRKDLIVVMHFFEDRQVPMGEGVSFSDMPKYRTEVDRTVLMCAERKLAVTKSEYYDSSNKLTYILGVDPSADITNWIEMKDGIISPLSTLRRIFCGEEFVGLGIQFEIGDGGAKVSNVIAGTPAAKVGILVNDVITNVDGQSLDGLSMEDVAKQLRGPTNSEAHLKISRSGQNTPLELVVTRETIKTQPSKETVKK